MKTFFAIICNYNPAAMYDSYEDSTRGPPHGPSRVHLKKKGRGFTALGGVFKTLSDFGYEDLI